jgi:WD40 repeat protein
LTVSEDVVTVWSWPECEKLRRFTIPREPFGWAIAKLLASSTDSKRLIASVRSVNRSGYYVYDSVGGTVDLFDTTTGNHLRRLPGSGGSEQAAFAGTGEMIVTSDRSDRREGSKSRFPHGAILVLDAETARVKRSVPAPGPDSTQATSTYDHIFAAAASPDGRTVYLARPEGTIHAWEVASGGVRYVLTGHRGEINALEVFSRGRRLASAGADASVLVWDVSIPAVNAPGRLDPAWDDLAAADASVAYKAIAALSAAPDRTIRLLAAHLTEARPEPATDVPTTGRMREIRALEVLELIGNADARDLLATLAKGEPTALRTHDAAACLRRLQAR